mmetsp:Transcript_8398/g.12291  ORF Transcript_8398/g.12291 Transcript_8398/m.12291 type:complete len:173 (-) Transcript_8398:188-706(-)
MHGLGSAPDPIPLLVKLWFRPRRGSGSLRSAARSSTAQGRLCKLRSKSRGYKDNDDSCIIRIITKSSSRNAFARERLRSCCAKPPSASFSATLPTCSSCALSTVYSRLRRLFVALTLCGTSTAKSRKGRRRGDTIFDERQEVEVLGDAGIEHFGDGKPSLTILAQYVGKSNF